MWFQSITLFIYLHENTRYSIRPLLSVCVCFLFAWICWRTSIWGGYASVVPCVYVHVRYSKYNLRSSFGQIQCFNVLWVFFCINMYYNYDFQLYTCCIFVAPFMALHCLSVYIYARVHVRVSERERLHNICRIPISMNDREWKSNNVECWFTTIFTSNEWILKYGFTVFLHFWNFITHTLLTIIIITPHYDAGMRHAPTQRLCVVASDTMRHITVYYTILLCMRTRRTRVSSKIYTRFVWKLSSTLFAHSLRLFLSMCVMTKITHVRHHLFLMGVHFN